MMYAFDDQAVSVALDAVPERDTEALSLNIISADAGECTLAELSMTVSELDRMIEKLERFSYDMKQGLAKTTCVSH